MNPGMEEMRGMESAFPGTFAGFLLRLFLPADRREELEGDLIEEAETIVLPRSGLRAAQRWFWWQMLTSAPWMLARRLEKETKMYPRRWTVPATLLMIWGYGGSWSWGTAPTAVSIGMIPLSSGSGRRGRRTGLA